MNDTVQAGSARLSECRIAFGQQLGAWPEMVLARQVEYVVNDLLQPMTKHRPVALVQDVATNLDHVVRSHAKDVSVERRVMQFAEREAVGNDGFSGDRRAKCGRRLEVPDDAADK